MKMLLRLSREAVRYKALYVIAILSTLMLTAINLAAPKVLSAMTGIVSNGVTFLGVLAVLLTINIKLALITCAPIPLIFISGIIFSKKVRPYFQKIPEKDG